MAERFLIPAEPYDAIALCESALVPHVWLAETALESLVGAEFGTPTTYGTEPRMEHVQLTRVGQRKAAANPIRVLIAERNPLVVAALRRLIEDDCRFAFVGSVQSGVAFIKAVSTSDFDVAVLGSNLLDMDGAKVLMELQWRKLRPRITMFSNDHDLAVLKRCVRLGVQGFCYQVDDPDILFETVLAVARGRICIPHIDIAKINDTPLSCLTNRELEMLVVLAEGWTNTQIATRIGISENTVKYHLKNLYERLGVRNRAMAVAVYSSERGSRA